MKTKLNELVNSSKLIITDYSPAIHYALLISFWPNLRLFF